jgi:prepilin-type N-terminal cleavage/methylation domain-containing protein
MSLNLKKGFTLVELLIVIAILGTLAVVVLIALNPVQQLARTRDSGRKQTVAQLGHAIEAYAAGRNGVYPPVAATWVTTYLVNTGEISIVPSLVPYSAPGVGGRAASTACTTNAQNGWCYAGYGAVTGGFNRAIVFARLESGADNGRCTGTLVAWAVYSTANGGGGILCTANQGVAPADPGVTGYSGANWIQ